MAMLALLSLSACGSNALDGSLAEALDLSFSSVVLTRSAKAFQVTYLKSEGREVVLRLTLATEGIALKEDEAVDLSGDYAPGHARATVTRATDGEPLLVLPPIENGTIELDDPPEVGKPMSGRFSLRFAEGGDTGAGRTVEGEFDGKLLGAD